MLHTKIKKSQSHPAKGSIPESFYLKKLSPEEKAIKLRRKRIKKAFEFFDIDCKDEVIPAYIINIFNELGRNPPHNQIQEAIEALGYSRFKALKFTQFVQVYHHIFKPRKIVLSKKNTHMISDRGGFVAVFQQSYYFDHNLFIFLHFQDF